MRLTFLLVLMLTATPVLSSPAAPQAGEEDFSWEFTQAMDVYQYDSATKKCATVSTKRVDRSVLFVAFRVIDGVQVYRFVSFYKPDDNAPPTPPNWVGYEDNGRDFCMSKAEFDELVQSKLIVKHYRTFAPELTYGAKLSLPFKLRRAIPGQPTRLHKDVSLDGLVGIRFRVSPSSPIHVVLPLLTLGLSTIQMDQGTAPSATETKTVTGVSGSIGAVFEIDEFQIGLVVGWDRAVGDEGRGWIYNSRPWYSLAIGYSFIGK